MTMPLAKLDLLLGYGTAFAAVSVIQALLTAGVAFGLLGLHIGGSPLLVMALAVGNAVLGMSLGLFTSAFARTEFQAIQFLPACRLSAADPLRPVRRPRPDGEHSSRSSPTHSRSPTRSTPSNEPPSKGRSAAAAHSTSLSSSARRYWPSHSAPPRSRDARPEPAPGASTLDKGRPVTHPSRCPAEAAVDVRRLPARQAWRWARSRPRKRSLSAKDGSTPTTCPPSAATYRLSVDRYRSSSDSIREIFGWLISSAPTRAQPGLRLGVRVQLMPACGLRIHQQDV